MKELRMKIADMIKVAHNMDEVNIHGVCHTIKTPEQAEKFIAWLETQDLPNSMRTPIIRKADEIVGIPCN